MKHFLCVIGSLFYGFCYAQHISEFESLHNTPQDSDFHLALTHDFQVIIQHGDPLSDGGSLPDNCDFSGFVPRESSSKYGYLSINSESAPGGVSILDIEYDDTSGKWEILKSESVPFPLFSFPTIANCSGTVTPWNTIISCEEYTSIRLKEDPRYGYPLDINFDGYHDFGWAIEIDPATKAVINQPGGRNGPDKLWAMGNFQHENAVVHKNKRTVYQGADNTVGEGFLYKFVADVEEKLVTGDLFVYRAGINGNGEWIQLKNKTPSEQNSTIAQSLAVNATNFIGIEDVEISPVDGKIYFAVKNESKVYRLEDSDPLAGMTTSGFETYVGGQDYEILPGVIEPWGRGNDNLAFDEKGNLWVLQDGDRNYIWVVENGHTQVSPRVKIFGRTPAGSEPTGITFSPDHKFLFMSIMHPSEGNSITSQKDALGKDISFDKDAVLVIARKEYFGPNQAGRHKELVITQYYHDTDSNSKWIELKNISGEKIPHSSYFMHLYADVLLPDISNNLPSASFDIPDMEIDEVILLKNSEAPPMPISTHIANVRQFQTDVCDFDGNDVLVLTSSPGSLRYANRRDVIGELDGSNWGANRSIIRGANSREEPEKDFNIFNWIVLNPDQEVDQADIQTNLALGTHGVGPTSWDGATWSNLWPDRTRSTILSAGKKLTEPLTS
ncbi:MAG: alkaline phosphatase PhoX, partial [Lutimonas sp.]